MHPCWVNEYREFDLGSDPRSTLLYEETELNAGLTQTLMSITLLGETECLRTCIKSQSQHARMEACPSINVSKHQAKVPSTVPTLCIIYL